MEGNPVFSYPKPVSLIKYLVNFVCKDEDIVMDFFSGSATTADAIMRYNLDNKNLRYILVQLPENLDDNLKQADSVSKEIIQSGINLLDKYKKPHYLTELAKLRIKKAAKDINVSNLDTGFRVFRLDESNYLEVKKSPKEYDQDMLGLFVDNIKADRTDLDLLFGSMLAWGVQLDMPMTTEQVDGCTVYTVNEGDLVACFSEPITDKVIQTMADKMPLRILFRDSCFTDDAQKINIYEQFKQLLDWADDEAFKNIKVI